MSDQVLELLEQVWSSIDEVCSELTPKEWDKLTDCPGWTVKDQLAHICAIESMMLGQERASAMDPAPPHVKNPMGAINEAAIERRRPLSPEEILTEFLEVTTARLKVLTDAPDWDAVTKGLLGEAPLREVIAVRVLDCFYHEQDIRRATGHAGHMDGDVARFVVDRMKQATPMIVAKRGQAPDGASVTFNVGSDAWFVQIAGGRGALGEGKAPAATATIACDAETFLCLTGGRWTAGQAEKKGRLELGGDVDLARRVVENAAVTP